MSVLNRCFGLGRTIGGRLIGGFKQARTLSYASTSLLSQQSNSRMKLFTARNFASQTETQLCDFLKQEIEDEKKQERELLGDLPTPTIPGFKIETSDAQVTLTKAHGAEKITVLLSVNNSVDTNAEFDADGPTPDEPAQMISRPPFTVEVEKGGEKLAFECRIIDPIAEGGQEEGGDLFAIEEMYVYSGKEVTEKTFVTAGAILDGTLYDRLMDYLDERGLNAEFVEAVMKFSTHYEHAQYTLVLQKVHDFVKA